MKFRNPNFYRIGSLFGLLLLILTAGAGSAVAQVGAATWDKPEGVVRQAKTKRVYRPRKTYRVRPKVERSPLLTVQYRVLIKRADGTEGEASLASVFHPGDQLRLGVTANQDGFLYVIYQKDGQDGVVQFPDSRVSGGENYVGRNREFILPPTNCPAPDPSECWYKVNNDPEKEFFIIVFSRDQIVDLPQKNGEVSAEARQAFASGVLRKGVIDEYIRSARVQDYKVYSRPARASSPASRYAVWVTNTNRADNEEIILRVPLNKGV
jgi:hypothetical protein